MATKEKILESFVNWARDTRKARDRAIAAEEDEGKKRLIRQIYNVKISTIEEAGQVLLSLGKDDDSPKPIIEIPGGSRN